MALTEDFHSFERYGIIMSPKDKDAGHMPTRGDTIKMYYGTADLSIALATGSVRGMLEWLDQHG